jgi:hypothetical protein
MGADESRYRLTFPLLMPEKFSGIFVAISIYPKKMRKASKLNEISHLRCGVKPLRVTASHAGCESASPSKDKPE